MSNSRVLEKEVPIQDTEESFLNQEISIPFLLQFTVPTILSMVLMSVFGVIDGVFASRQISVEALSAVNVTLPFFTLTMALGYMLAMGGSVLVAKKKGMKNKQEARENFTLLTILTLVTSVIISAASLVFLDPLITLLGASQDIFDLTRAYLIPIIFFLPSVMLGIFLVQFLIAEGRPVLGMVTTILGAALSTGLNALFLFHFDMGVYALAYATGIGYSISTVISVAYFTFARKGTIYFVRPKWDIHAIGKSLQNGLSEMITLMATSVTTIVMNNVLVRSVGFEGVAAAGIVLAVQAIFTSLFFGYSAGVAPVISYNYGKDKKNRLTAIFNKSLIIVGGLSFFSLIIVQLFANLLVSIYVPAQTEIYLMTVKGLRISGIGFLLMGYNVFATGLFTAFNDGKISGFMSFMRTLVFTLGLLVTLPRVFDLTGVWVALPLAEVASILLTVYFLLKYGKTYGYRAKIQKTSHQRKLLLEKNRAA